MMRGRLAVYLQLSFLFVGAVYLLFAYDNALSWGIPYYSGDYPWPTKPETSTPASAPVYAPSTSFSVPQATSVASSPHSPTITDEGSEELEEDDDKVDNVTHHEAEEDEDEAEEEDGGKEPSTDEQEEADSEADATSPTAPASEPTSTPIPKLSQEELFIKAHTLISSILDPSDTSVDRMSCPAINATRYEHLKASRWERKHKYFFALNLRQCVDLLPRLLGSVLEAINFLGPAHCAVSIVEGNSDDGTLQVLELLRSEFDRLGVTYYLRSSALNPASGDRIETLSMLRAIALEPVTGILTPDTVSEFKTSTTQPDAHVTRIEQLPLSGDATVLFLNDVSACAEDLLELAHQRIQQSADMTCAMDWTHPGESNPIFYDVWVSRAINGDLFFDIPADTGSWDFSSDLFFNEPVARSRLASGLPFQVFACWNGAVAFTAEPLVKNEVGFRAVMDEKDECFMGEPTVFCKDMWWTGYGRVAVVPSVNLEYSDGMGRRVKAEKGFVSDWVGRDGDMRVEDVVEQEQIEWMGPPEMIKCMPTFTSQSWVPWNQSLRD
jgi:alpha-1,3-mannosyltransferase